MYGKNHCKWISKCAEFSIIYGITMYITSFIAMCKRKNSR